MNVENYLAEYKILPAIIYIDSDDKDDNINYDIDWFEKEKEEIEYINNNYEVDYGIVYYDSFDKGLIVVRRKIIC